MVVVKGKWVYDSLHYGWNEIHPVRACQIIPDIHTPTDTIWWKQGKQFKDFTYKDPDTGNEFTLDSVDHIEKFRCFWCKALKALLSSL
jgi:hypothetical protein